MPADRIRPRLDFVAWAVAMSFATSCTVPPTGEESQSGSAELVGCGFFAQPNCFGAAVAAVYGQCSPTADPDKDAPGVSQPDGVTCSYPSGNSAVLDEPLPTDGLGSYRFNFTVHIDGQPCARHEGGEDATTFTTPLGNIGIRRVWDPAVEGGWAADFSCPSGKTVRIGEEALKSCDNEHIPSLSIMIGTEFWGASISPSDGSSLFRCADPSD